MAKKSGAKTSAPNIRNPLFLRQQGLSFEGLEDEDVIALTPDQQADRFLSRWMEGVDPFVEYKRTFQEGEKAANRLLLEVKRYYKHFVLEESWSEVKYVLTINNIFETRAGFFKQTIEKHGILYDNEELLSQRRMRRRNRG